MTRWPRSLLSVNEALKVQGPCCRGNNETHEGAAGCDGVGGMHTLAVTDVPHRTEVTRGHRRCHVVYTVPGHGHGRVSTRGSGLVKPKTLSTPMVLLLTSFLLLIAKRVSWADSYPPGQGWVGESDSSI